MKEKVKVTGLLGAYLQWPLFLSVLVVGMNVAVGMISMAAGFTMCAFTIVYIIIAIWIYLIKRKRLMNGMVEFAAGYTKMQGQLLLDMKVPYAVSDDEGKLLWMNEEFQLIVNEEKGARKSLSSVFQEVDKDFFTDLNEEKSVHISHSDRRYRLDVKPMFLEQTDDNQEGLDGLLPAASGKKNGFLAVYLFDETEIVLYKQQIDEQKLVVGLIYLDNYEEVLESIEEVRYSLLMALIDRKISKYISGLNGVVKKMEKDKYFFILQRKYVEELMESRFSILEDVKTVNIGNEMSVTLSIGLGMGGDTYNRNYDFSRTAIDMALGRGGDQAVVKEGQKIQYFGGKSQQQEKTTRVKARVKAHALRELLETKDRLLIMGHKLSDIDAFGAAVGIYRIAAELNKKANIVINEVTSSVRPMMDRFIGNPDYPEDLFLKGEQAAGFVDGNTILVVVDVNRPSIADAPELLNLVKTIVVLDHHRQSSEIINNAVLSYVEPYASSTCEMVAEILQYVADGIKIKSPEADAMYAGIVIDTNNFTNQTGVRTFEAAAYLRRSGADITRVKKLFRDNMEDYQARAQAIQNMEVFEGAFAISVCPSESIQNPTIVAAQAANEMLNIVGMKASIVVSKYNGTVYFSARSIDEVNVQVMMEQLGGGGHRSIAGAQIKEIEIDEAIIRLKEVIRDMLKKGDIS